MNKVLFVSMLVVSAAASMAQAFDMGGPLESRTINLGNVEAPTNTPTVVYSQIPGPYSAFAAATGVLGFEDYQSISATDFGLDSMRFVGGVTAVGGILDFEFYDSSANFVDGFSVQFGTAGNFIWSITGIGGMSIKKDGIMQIRARTGTTGQWFFTTTAPSVGTNNINYGSGSGLSPQRSQAYELTAVPEPGTMSALALGALAALRRRRAK